ncbi:MAG: carboxyl transferase domain-containing protein [Acidimicrobiales bacterium]
MDPRLVERLEAARASQLDAARPEAVERVHRAGRLTARERLAALLDPGSEVPYGTIAAVAADGSWVAEAGGVDAVGTVDGRRVITSSTDFTDRGGGYGAGRLERLFALAREHRWPVVFFVDGGGSRARHPRVGRGDLELNGPFGRFQLFDGMAELSGWVPTIAIVSGPSFAGHASLAGFSDIVIATGGSSIGMGGPPMVEAALGVAMTASELAGVEMHETTGGIDLLVGDEHEAIAVARRCLAYQHDLPSGGAADNAGRVADLVPEDGPYDMGPVIEALVDRDSFTALRPAFAPSVITGFARMDGRAVGIIASQPVVDDGAIDQAAATKIGRMVELCDSYELPIVSLIDTPGCVTTFTTATSATGNGTASEQVVTQPGLDRWHLRPVMAHHHRTVPLFAVQLRRGGGLGPAVLAGLTSGRSTPVLWLAWPTTELGPGDGFAAVRNQHAFDDVVAPAATRELIVRSLAGIVRRPTHRTAKKHPVDTW